MMLQYQLNFILYQNLYMYMHEKYIKVISVFNRLRNDWMPDDNDKAQKKIKASILNCNNWQYKHTPVRSSLLSWTSLSGAPSSPASLWFRVSWLITIFSCGESLGVELGAVGDPLGAFGEFLYCSVSPKLGSSSSEGISEDCRELVPVPRSLLFFESMASRPLSEADDCKPSPVL